jgi:hypothetical protein
MHNPVDNSSGQDAEVTTVGAASTLEPCGFCPEPAVMIVNGVAMCQCCGDEERDVLASWMESKHGHRD